MSGYQNSQACKLIATHCCCCGRLLENAISVETGVGTICRKTHGYEEAHLAPDWMAYDAIINCEIDSLARLKKTYPAVSMSTMLGMVLSASSTYPPGPRSQRDLAKILTHRIAADIKSPTVDRDILALLALGFSALAERIAERILKIKQPEPPPIAPPPKKPERAVEYGYPGPQAALCTVCGKFSWLCPHPWELREAGSAWEAFARGMPWPPTRVVEERKAAAAAEAAQSPESSGER